jgi:hypothetical protein
LDGVTPLEKDLLLDSAASINNFLSEVLDREPSQERDMKSAVLASPGRYASEMPEASA